MKKIIIAIICVLIVGVVIWYSKSATPAIAPAQPNDSTTVTKPAVDSTASINQDLQSIDVSSKADVDFNSVNQDINTL